MKVSIITPTLRRPEFLRNAIAQYNAQDYPDKELILVIDKEDFWTVEWLEKNMKYQSDIVVFTCPGICRVGMKRNNGVMIATGDIIVHMDDDDIYADDWVSKSVEALQKCRGNVTGLSRAFFKKGDEWYLWEWPVEKNGILTQPYVCEATMCYYREHASLNPFPNVIEGEGREFCGKSTVRAHDYISGFTAIVHGGNICSDKAIPLMKPVTPEPARQGI